MAKDGKEPTYQEQGREGLEEWVILDKNSEIIGGVSSTRNGSTLGTGCPSRGLGGVQEPDRDVQITGLFLPRELEGWVFVELDVGSEGNADGSQIQEVLHSVISSGSIGPYVTSPWGFKFRRLGTGELVLQTRVTLPLQFLRLWPISRSLLWAFLTWTSTRMETRNSLHPEPEPEPNHQFFYSLYLGRAKRLPLTGISEAVSL